MNSVVIIGRVCADPEIRWGQGNEPVAFGNYTLAVDRPAAKGKEPITDFIYVKVVGKTAEFAEKYLRKGMKIAIEGRLQVDRYEDNNGNKRSTTYVQALQHEFCESKQREDSVPSPVATPRTDADGFMSIPDGIDEELPFN